MVEFLLFFGHVAKKKKQMFTLQNCRAVDRLFVRPETAMGGIQLVQNGILTWMENNKRGLENFCVTLGFKTNIWYIFIYM